MNEFIVWDEEYEEFIDEKECVFKDGTLYRNHDDYLHFVSDDLTMLWAVKGKTDIEGNKIYTDSSIFEFDIIDESGTTRLKGFFTWNDIDLRYEIDMLEGQMPYVSLYYNDERMSNFRIIDTIQENKLGLCNAE